MPFKCTTKSHIKNGTVLKGEAIYCLKYRANTNIITFTNKTICHCSS